MGKNGTGTATGTDEGDYACLRCPVPEGCDEADPRCLLRQERGPFKKSKWSRVYEQIALLMPGEEDGVIVRRAEVRSLQRGISGQHCAGRLPKIETWREDAWGDSCRLCFRVVGEEDDGETRGQIDHPARRRGRGVAAAPAGDAARAPVQGGADRVRGRG